VLLLKAITKIVFCASREAGGIKAWQRVAAERYGQLKKDNPYE